MGAAGAALHCGAGWLPQAVLRGPAHSASPRAGAAQLRHPHLGVSLISVSPCRSLAFAHPKNHFGTVLCCPKETCAGAGPGRRAAGPQRSARPRGTEPVPEMETRLLGAPGATMGNVTKSRINAPENPTSGDLLLIPPPQRYPLQTGPLCPAALCPLVSQRSPKMPGCSWRFPGRFASSQCLLPPTTRAFQNTPGRAAQVAGVGVAGSPAAARAPSSTTTPDVCPPNAS